MLPTVESRQAIIKRYYAARRSDAMRGVDDCLVRYGQKQKVQTHLVEATWGQVIAISLITAFGIFLAKVTIFAILGKPDLQSATPDDYPLGPAVAAEAAPNK